MFQNTSAFEMDTSHHTEDSIMDVQRQLREALIKEKPQVIEEILVKHPELVNHEYDEEGGYSGTPLIISCDRIKMSAHWRRERNAGMYNDNNNNFI